MGEFHDSKVGPGAEEIGSGQEMPVEIPGVRQWLGASFSTD